MRVSPILSVLLVGALVFFAGYWFLVLPQFKELGTVFKELDAYTPTGVGIKSSDREKRLADIKELTERTEALLPTFDKQYDLSVQLEAAAQNAGVALTSLGLNTVESNLPKTTSVQATDDSTGTASTPAPAAGAPTSGPKKITITLAATGTYENIKRWVQEITGVDRFIQIDALSLSNSSGKDEVTAQLTAFAYYLPATGGK